MKEKKEFLNTVQPNVFLSLRKVFGIFFLCLVHLLSANVINGNNESVVLDSLSTDHQDQVQPQGNIYISSGTTIVTVDKPNFTIVKVESAPVKSNTKKASPPKKLLTVKKQEKKLEGQIKEKKYVNSYKFSGTSPSEISFSRFSRTKLAVLGSSNHKIENGEVVLLLFDFSQPIIDIESRSFSYSDSVFSNYQFALLFVRPPPAVI
ncbi:hypothetical protein PQ459_08905 [Chryseobacterium sp. KACC 21268]|nr:hypothetical protein PQ459_08905 [Chryseobacterium sp. KACC 21268]